MKWQVLVKTYPDVVAWEAENVEVSVVREDNKRGMSSFGWGNERKIILFGTGSGCNSCNDYQFAIHVAHTLCNALNAGDD